MKKTFAVVLVILAAALCFAACTMGSYSFIQLSENSGGDYWEASYEKFNGYKAREVTLSGGGEHVFSVETVTNSGSLGMSIKAEDGTVLYEGTAMPTSSFAVTADAEGKYWVRFDAEDHGGSFSVEWE